jgi:hypothetical protein
VTGSPRASLVDEHAYSLQVQEAARWKAKADAAQVSKRGLSESLAATEGALHRFQEENAKLRIEVQSAEGAMAEVDKENIKLLAESQRLKLFVESSPDQEAKFKREVDERLRKIDKDSARRVAGLQRYGEEVTSLFRLHSWLHRDDPMSEESGGESPPQPGASSSPSAATTTEASELFFV